MSGIILCPQELEALTGYQQCTKQLRVLHARGFLRAYISRRGDLVLERTHYEAVSRGEVLHVANGKPVVKAPKAANLDFWVKQHDTSTR
jgi:Domain of unknown function (DUF4224)